MAQLHRVENLSRGAMTQLHRVENLSRGAMAQLHHVENLSRGAKTQLHRVESISRVREESATPCRKPFAAGAAVNSCAFAVFSAC